MKVTKRDIANEKQRQEILDFLNARGSATTAELSQHFGWKSTIGPGSTMFNMLDLGEIERSTEKVPVVGVYGRNQRTPGNVWTAKTTKTISAAAARAIRNAAKEAALLEDMQEEIVEHVRQPIVWKDGRAENKDPNRPAQRCPDAMGSRGLGFGIQSSFQVI